MHLLPHAFPHSALAVNRRRAGRSPFLLPSRFAARRRYRRCLSRLSVWVALSGLVTGVSVSAQEPSGKPLLSATQVTGDWGGARPKLEDRGVRFSLFYNHYYGHKDAGGLEPTSHGRRFWVLSCRCRPKLSCGFQLAAIPKQSSSAMSTIVRPSTSTKNISMRRIDRGRRQRRQHGLGSF